MTAADAQHVEWEMVSAEPRPGPGARVSRSAGQAGGAMVLLELAAAFSWFGSGDWSTGQWRAVTASGVFLLAVGQNLYGAWRER